MANSKLKKFDIRNTLARITQNKTAYLYVIPALAGLIFLVLYPFAYDVWMSFTNWNVYHDPRLGNLAYVGFRNYLVVFKDPAFVQIMENTGLWTAGCVIPTVAIGLLLALVLNSKTRGKNIYRVLLIVPWAMPSFITLLVWRGMLDYEFGIVNAVLSEFSFQRVDWLADPHNAFLAMVLANIWLGYPFMMIIFSGALQGIPNELYEAAAIDGAVGWREIRYVVVPLLKPTLLIALLLGSIWTFNNFNAGYLITAGGPGISTTIFIVEAYNLAFTAFSFAESATYAFIAFLILFVVGILWFRYTGIIGGSKKEKQ
jgi:arabinogalactan oligomer / maltooligosaccharide transport system permease protein